MQQCSKLRQHSYGRWQVRNQLHSACDYLYICSQKAKPVKNSKTASMKLFIDYKREMYAPAHLNMSTASFKFLS